ncbi:YbhN family protein [Kribbella sp. NPDC050124]|uniref:YbhN family protein n=1 Tax=Kribbella sp. NPDC050124 TaxID=3364114 RepID=UPI0037ACE791
MLPPSATRTTWPALLRSAASLLILVVLVKYVVVPKLADAEDSLHLLAEIRPGWVALGIGLEALSLLCYSLFTRALLRTSPIRFSWILRSDLTGFGASHVLPGGGATATAIRFRLLVSGGARTPEVTATIAAEGVGTWLALVLVTWLTTGAALLLDATALYLAVFLIGTCAIACGLLAVRERSRVERLAGRLLRWTLHRLPQRVRPWTVSVALRLRELLADREVRKAFLRWATANWVLDAAALWVFLAAYGERVQPVILLLAYCAASMAAILPITPGGLGVVEGVLISTLLGFGVPADAAVLGVLSWRLIQFWAPVPVAGLCYLSLRAETHTRRIRRRAP